jgi:hypothetical protein
MVYIYIYINPRNLKKILTKHKLKFIICVLFWQIYWTVSSTNKNSEFFPEPEKFDPSRYDDANAFPPFTFVRSIWRWSSHVPWERVRSASNTHFCSQCGKEVRMGGGP